MTSLSQIRETFLGHFKARGHSIVPSAPLVPDDPTLMFVAAGMVPFKKYFTGEETPAFTRAASSQKCLRAGGKHNDLDNVGFTARHHTFFEMLGNFSFGDYFKEEAIEAAWALVTGEVGLDPQRLLVTVYAEDEDAADLWKKIAGLTDDRIIRIATADNFWSMGDTGPCGPCSEIFFDHGPDVPGGPPGSPDEDGDRFVEIWNLVFMQFDQQADGRRLNLPKPSIDTGMGLERMATVLQGVHSNFETDLFRVLLRDVDSVLGAATSPDLVASGRVIADHVRAGAFLIADGVLPSNEGRGYVLRRILRRAMRHAHLRGADEPVLWRLVSTLNGLMGDAYPELRRAEAVVTATFQQEEERFQRMLGRGLNLLEEEVKDLGPGDALPGSVAFKLHDTFGFPLDLTQDALRARQIDVDVAGFEAAMAAQQAEARAHWAGSGSQVEDSVWQELSRRHPPTHFYGYDRLSGEGVVLALLFDGQTVETLEAGASGQVILDQTPFYAEGGGQVGDVGVLSTEDGRATVRDVVRKGHGLYAHDVKVSVGGLQVGATVHLAVDAGQREKTIANHSGTHLLHAALRRVLGPHVTQRGSYVGPDRLRFDFSHDGVVTDAQITAIEDDVNAAIRANIAADIRHMTPDAAVEEGALALFGEKYGDEVRVLRFAGLDGDPSPVSMELCGGCHVERTGDIGLLVIVAQSGVAAGVRRLEALTGQAALEWQRARARDAQTLADQLKVPLAEASARLSALQEERRDLERRLRDARKELAKGGGTGQGTADAAETVAGLRFVGRVVEGVEPRDLRGLVDEAKATMGSGVAAFVAVSEAGKAALAVGVTGDLTDRVDARELVRAGVVALGGKGGGGRADMAQAGGPDGARASEAVGVIREALSTAGAPA